MAKFSYQARDGGGDLATGIVNAATMEEAAKSLRAEGKYIVKIVPAAKADDDDATVVAASRSKRVKRKEVIFFAHQLAVMIETGVPLTDALESTRDQAANPHFKAVLNDVTAHVEAGGDFSSALAKYPRVFPNAMVSLIRASEISGTMAQMLDRLSGYLTKEEQTARQVKGALMYPIFMLVMAVSVTIFLLAFVLPKFAGIYASRGAALPAPTRLLLAISEGLIGYWYLWTLLAIVVGGVVMMLPRVDAGRRFLDYLKLNVPLAKQLFTQLYITRATRTMGTMIAAGVTMLDMIDIVKQVTNNIYYQDLWDEVDDRLRQGSQLSDPLFASPLFPRTIAQMIYSGEKSGQLGKVLARISDFTEAEFDQTVKNTTQFIEPLMVGVMGTIIGFIAISLLLPIFSVGNVVAGTG
jgi:type IV pilus assembly protein PilC